MGIAVKREAFWVQIYGKLKTSKRESLAYFWNHSVPDIYKSAKTNKTKRKFPLILVSQPEFPEHTKNKFI